MARAVFAGQTIAESNETIVVDGNHYFPPTSVNMNFLVESTKRTVCGWKGEAHYHDVVVGTDTAGNAVWHYPETKAKADNIKGYFAFWNGVTVEG